MVIMASACFHEPTKGKLNVHILTEELSKRGNKVIFVESLGLRDFPSGSPYDVKKVLTRIFSFFRMLLFGPYTPMENVYVVSLLRIPFNRYKIISSINEWIVVHFVKKYCKKYSFKNPILWLFLPIYPYLKRKIKNSLCIYYAVDDFSENPLVFKPHIIERERKTIRNSDIIFTVSPIRQKEFLSKFEEKEIMYLNNVARFNQFNKSMIEKFPPPQDIENIVKLGKPIIGYTGNLVRYKEDMDLLLEIVKEGREYNFVFIGAYGYLDMIGNVGRLKMFPNVFFLGSKNYEELYKYFKFIDVAIIPRKINKSTQGGFPLKYFEFLSSGIPVVITGIGSVGEFSKLSMLGGVANNAREFKTKIGEWVNMKKENKAYYEKCVKERLKLAKQNSWDKRMIEFEKIITPLLNDK